MVATDEIIKELCLANGDPQFLGYNRFLGGVIDGIRDLSIFNMPCYSHAVLDINSYNSVEWPCSAIKPLVTCLLRDDRCVILDVSDDIVDTFPVKRVDTPECSTDDEIKDAFRIDGYYFNWYGSFNWGLGEIYGLSSYMAYGYIQHNINTRMSTIKGNCVKSTDQVVMFFISNGLDECPKFVPDQCKTALKHYALYTYFMISNPNFSELSLKNYKENFTRLQKFDTGDDAHTWIAALNSNTKSSPK